MLKWARDLMQELRGLRSDIDHLRSEQSGRRQAPPTVVRRERHSLEALAQKETADKMRKLGLITHDGKIGQGAGRHSRSPRSR